MIKITVPGYKDFTLAHRVLDFIGTLTCNARLIHGVKRGVQVPVDRLQVHVLTANTVCAGSIGTRSAVKTQTSRCNLAILIPPAKKASRLS
jgi:hypothetical protein